MHVFKAKKKHGTHVGGKGHKALGEVPRSPLHCSGGIAQVPREVGALEGRGGGREAREDVRRGGGEGDWVGILWGEILGSGRRLRELFFVAFGQISGSMKENEEKERAWTTSARERETEGRVEA